MCPTKHHHISYPRFVLLVRDISGKVRQNANGFRKMQWIHKNIFNLILKWKKKKKARFYSDLNVALGIDKIDSFWIKEYIHSLGVQYKRFELNVTQCIWVRSWTINQIANSGCNFRPIFFKNQSGRGKFMKRTTFFGFLNIHTYSIE